MDDLAAALEQATKEFDGDSRRTYLTGLSMGKAVNPAFPIFVRGALCRHTFSIAAIA